MPHKAETNYFQDIFANGRIFVFCKINDCSFKYLIKSLGVWSCSNNKLMAVPMTNQCLIPPFVLPLSQLPLSLSVSLPLCLSLSPSFPPFLPFFLCFLCTRHCCSHDIYKNISKVYFLKQFIVHFGTLICQSMDTIQPFRYCNSGLLNMQWELWGGGFWL